MSIYLYVHVYVFTCAYVFVLYNVVFELFGMHAYAEGGQGDGHAVVHRIHRAYGGGSSVHVWTLMVHGAI